MKHIHFIAIGGAIMHQLALALHRQGYLVTGSDDEINDPARANLEQAGILPPAIGWYPEKINTRIDGIVLGMHARADNPELLQAKALQIPIYSFPQYVYEVCKAKKRVVIAGSHGKTTITSMVMHILKDQNVAFDYLVGAKVPGFDTSVKLTDAPLIVIEGDEYPASVEEKRPKIFFYHPHLSLISGIAWDHINVFPTYENYFGQFNQYLTGLEEGVPMIYNAEDSEVVRAVTPFTEHLHLIAYSTPQYHYEMGQPVLYVAEEVIKLGVFGRHNIQNTKAAVSICKELNIPELVAYRALESFTGAARRLEKVIETSRVLIYRDFAHAPSKLVATLNAVREAYPAHYLIACFELHTYSSLNEQFLAEYTGTMDQADEAIVYFSQHALKIKGLPDLDPTMVATQFHKENMIVENNPTNLEIKIQELVAKTELPVFLLLMSSGTFDGIDWKTVSSLLK